MTIVAALTAFVTTVAFVPLSIMIAQRLGLLDQPEARKVHKSPTPRLGGIAIAAGILAALVATSIYLALSGHPVSKPQYQQLLAIGGAGLFVFLVGLVDDVRTISSRFKLLTLIAASAVTCGSGALLGELWFGGELLMNFGWINWLITILWIVGIAVSINFMDGLDGLATGLGMLSAAVLAVGLISNGNLVAAVIPAALAASLAGFMLFNWHPAKTFMGDSGSMLIGFLLASSMAMANPLIGTMEGVILPSLALSVAIVDAVLTMFRRHYQQRRSVFSAERGHIHHRLLDRGFTHKQTVITIHLVSLLAVGIGLIALSMEGWSALGGFALLLPLVLGTFRLAGSVRTDDMLLALRRKRELDRASRRQRENFESLQLEFQHVTTLSHWWQGVCRAAERLDFLRVELTLPSTTSNPRRLEWKTDDTSRFDGDSLHATIPISERKRTGEVAPMKIEIASLDSLELAGERLSLFSRLMTEYSLDQLHKNESKLRSSTSQVRNLPKRTVDLPSSGEYGTFGHLRVAIVHDFLYTYCGAERVVEQLINVFPHCDMYALFDFLPEEERGFLRDKPVTTSFLQQLPFARSAHRCYLPLMPLAIEQLDVSGYDLVISSSYLAAKGVITGPDQLHVCYCHSPARYAWDLQHQYLHESGLNFGPRGMLARSVLHYLRTWDVRSSTGVDHFIANSEFIARRIEKVYRRPATVIHPPVDTESFTVGTRRKRDGYVVVGRMVPYKQTAMIVAAFSEMPERHLVVIGDGPEMEAVRAIAGENVEILGRQPADRLIEELQTARALIFAAEEDFGIVPVEALACGTPVIAYRKGGVIESIIEEEHGIFFDEQTEESLIEAVDRFEAAYNLHQYDPDELHHRSLDFSNERFVEQITERVKKWAEVKWASKSGSHEARRGRDVSAGDAHPSAESLATAKPKELPVAEI